MEPQSDTNPKDEVVLNEEPLHKRIKIEANETVEKLNGEAEEPSDSTNDTKINQSNSDKIETETPDEDNTNPSLDPIPSIDPASALNDVNSTKTNQADNDTVTSNIDVNSQSGSGIPPDTSANNSTNSPVVPAVQIVRDKCAYGSSCYRRNPLHKSKYSHPGDPDYDVVDNRPQCPFGIRCYRKNAKHKQDFKHSRNRTLRAQNQTRFEIDPILDFIDFSDDDDESVDESDYEPSNDGYNTDDFIDDDDIDD